MSLHNTYYNLQLKFYSLLHRVQTEFSIHNFIHILGPLFDKLSETFKSSSVFEFLPLVMTAIEYPVILQPDLVDQVLVFCTQTLDNVKRDGILDRLSLLKHFFVKKLQSTLVVLVFRFFQPITSKAETPESRITKKC